MLDCENGMKLMLCAWRGDVWRYCGGGVEMLRARDGDDVVL